MYNLYNWNIERQLLAKDLHYDLFNLLLKKTTPWTAYSTEFNYQMTPI